MKTLPLFLLALAVSADAHARAQAILSGAFEGQAPVWTHAGDSGLGLGKVLIVLADDVGVDRIGCYDDPEAHTPVIDRLAEEGVKFTNCWANPVCSPTRATLLTGQYSFRTGVGENVHDFELAVGIPTIADLFWDRTDVLGKWHLSQDLRHPGRVGVKHLGSMRNLTYQGGNYGQWLKSVHGEEAWVTVYPTTDTVDDTIESTADLRVVSFNAPHHPWHIPPPELHTFGSIPLWDVPTLHRAALEALDTELGRLLQAVDDDTLVIFLGDNGTPHQATGHDHSKGSMYQGGVHVLLIVKGPGVATGGTSDALVNTTDLYATIVDALGLDVIPPSDSYSFWPQAVEPRIPGRRKWAYAEKFSPNGSGPYVEYKQTIRGERYKLIRRLNEADELYDLLSDPAERHDLLPVADPTSGAARAYEQLSGWLPVNGS